MTVLNKHRHNIPPDAVYIGRGSIWGNPFIIGKHGSRDEVIEKYVKYLRNRVKANEVSLQQLASLYRKDLVCFCAPLKCHGDILMKAAEWAHEKINAAGKIISANT